MNYYFQDKDSTIIAFQTEEELGRTVCAEAALAFGRSPVVGSRTIRLYRSVIKGPRRSLPTPWSTVAVEVCERLGVPGTKTCGIVFSIGSGPNVRLHVL